jgi:hypothetical protein
MYLLYLPCKIDTPPFSHSIFRPRSTEQQQQQQRWARGFGTPVAPAAAFIPACEITLVRQVLLTFHVALLVLVPVLVVLMPIQSRNGYMTERKGKGRKRTGQVSP